MKYHPEIFVPILIILSLFSQWEQQQVLAEPQVPCFFIFGDSIVDNGNNNFRQTTSRADFLPYGIDFPGGPTGRFSNGRNIADILAELLGFEKHIPRYANATNEDFVGGVNYGSGGAGILDETGTTLGDVISYNEQLSNHKGTVRRLAELLGGRLAARRHLRKCIYYVGLGNNDYLLNYFPKFYSSSAPYNPQNFTSLLIAQYSKQLRKLYRYGARKVAMFGTGVLGCVPLQITKYGGTDSSGCVGTINEVSSLFNQKLKRLISDLNNRLVDATFIYTNDTVTSYGNITNLTDPCCNVSTSDGACIAGTVPCNNREEHFFWDAVHPSEAATMITGKVAYISMSPLYSTTDLIQTW
ncbi:GDSL esterase/lipase At1g29660-like [Primulina eburnea]|uniref:GDSL esterase/lipase At1g29660-like n=1 Tax=Primulina eburnea TaxID=1245227 RepID=UPI003C6C971F